MDFTAQISIMEFSIVGSMKGYQLPVSDARWQHGSPDMFCNFYLAKNHKIAKNSATANS
jgi:hypothetical protein